MKLDAEILIRQYYDEVKDQYPNIEFDEFKKICHSPFEFVKEQMASEDLPVIRLKYFGTFLVYPKRAQSLLKKLRDRYKFKKIDEEEFLRIENMLKKYIASNEKTS